jgi:hypothetical protein
MPASIYGGGYRNPPMSIENMRENGVRWLSVECRSCRHQSSVNVDDWPGEIPVPAAGRRFRCRCGSKEINTRPDWSKQFPTPIGQNNKL